MSSPPLSTISNMINGRSTHKSTKATFPGQAKTPIRSTMSIETHVLSHTQHDPSQIPFRRRRVSPVITGINLTQHDSSSSQSLPVGSQLRDGIESVPFFNDDISIQATIEVDGNQHSDISVEALHSCCANATSIADLDRISSMLTVESASTLDANGRTALHILSENVTILEVIWGSYQQHHHPPSTTPKAAIGWTASFPSLSNQHRENRGLFRRTDSNASINSNMPDPFDEQNVELWKYLASTVQNMWKIYPPAIITTDNRGYIPFEAALQEWVQSYQNNEVIDTSGYHSTMQSIARSVQVSSALIPSMKELKNSVASRWISSIGIGYQNQQDTGGSQRSLSQRCNSPDVEASSNKSHSIKTSQEMAHSLTGVKLTAHALSSILMLSNLLDLMDSSAGDNDLERTEPSCRTQRTMRRQSIEDLLKQHSHQDMRTSIVQITSSIPDIVKVCLYIDNESQRNHCVRTTLLRNVLLSKHSIGTGRWLTDMLQSQVRPASDLAINYLQIVSSSSLIVDRWNPNGNQAAPRKQLKIGATSQDDFYNEMSRVNDFVPSLLSLNENQIEEAATTKVVEEVLDRIISRPFAVTIVFSDGLFLALMIFGYRRAVNALLLGNSPGIVLKYIYFANIGIFYFVIREIGKAISICTITRRTHVYFTFWNLIELLTTILAMVSSVAIRSTFTPLRSLLAVTTGFMWLRVLSYLKGINMQLATFVLAILQIGSDLLWFAVILLVVVLMFSQMFFTLMAPNNCSGNASAMNLNSYECSQSEYYLKVYAILLGDFGLFKRENFNSVFSISLAVFFTFLTTTILLNVLIAVASDSYEKCLMRSNKLFGRARVLMIAELVAFQNLLTFQDLIEQDGSWWNRSFALAKGRSRSSVIFFVLSLLVTTLWTIGEVLGSLLGSHYGNLLMSLGSVVVNVLLLCGVIFFLSSGGSDHKDQYYRSWYLDWYSRYFQSTMVRMLGSSSSKIHFSGTEIIWQGRLHYLRNEMVRISDNSEKKRESELESLRTFLDVRESTLQGELADMKLSLKESYEENRQLLEKISELLNESKK